MAVPQNTGFDRRVLGALEAAPSRIPVVLGGCGTGRTVLLQRLRDRTGRATAQYINVERCATTPERFLQAVVGASPFPATSADRFVLTTRYIARAHRLLRDTTSRFEVIHIPALTAADVTDFLAPAFNGYEQMPTDDRDYLGRAVQALTDGRAAYVRAVGDTMAQMV